MQATSARDLWLVSPEIMKAKSRDAKRGISEAQPRSFCPASSAAFGYIPAPPWCDIVMLLRENAFFVVV